MAKFTGQLPPLENWASQTFAYGFMLDRSDTPDYSGNAAPNQSNKSGFANPHPDDLHLLNLNPQALSFDEPIATEVRPSQGGGKFVESRGGVMKTITIRGTTGILPPIAAYATHMEKISSLPTNVNAFPAVSATRATGFYEFFRLRGLFRKFMDERKAGKIVAMHWLNFKEDDFWRIEPLRFRLDRTRFGYNYDINFELLEPSQARPANMRGDSVAVVGTRDRGADALKLLRNPLNAAIDSPTRKALTRISQMSSSAKRFVQQFSTGVLTLKFQSVLNKATAIQSFFADLSAIRRTILETPLSLYRQLYSALIGLENAYTEVTQDAFKEDINEWCVEMRFLTEGLIAHHVATYGTTVGQAFIEENKKFTQPLARQGTKDNFFEETSASSGSLTVDPFVGSSGLNLIGDLQKMAATTALRAEDVLTGETIFDFAQRVLGDAQRFVDVVVVNQLAPPFIVSDPKNKPPGTVAWQEKLYVPAVDDEAVLNSATPVYAASPSFSDAVFFAHIEDLTLVEADTTSNPWRTNMWAGHTVEITSGVLLGEKRVVVSNTASVLRVNRAFASAPAGGVKFSMRMETFSQRKTVTPETAAFGRDMMAVFSKTNGIISEGTVDVVMGPSRDLARVEGLDNLEQAIALCLQTPRGSNKANPQYGVVRPIGRLADPNEIALYVFSVRQALLQDPRIASVERPRVVFENGTMSFTGYVRAVRVQRTAFFRIPIQ